MKASLPRHATRRKLNLVDLSLKDARWTAERLNPAGTVKVSYQDLSALASSLRRVSVERGRALYTPGKFPEGVWIIRSGGVGVVFGSGKGRCVVQVLRSGDAVGDVYLILRTRPLFAARAIENSDCFFMTAESFYRLLDRHPSLGMLWAASLSARLDQSRRRVRDVLVSSLPQRAATLLLQESADGCVRLPQREIAAMLGVQRSSLNQVLKELEKRGLVEVGYGRVFLKDKNALGLVASGALA